MLVISIGLVASGRIDFSFMPKVEAERVTKARDLESVARERETELLRIDKDKQLEVAGLRSRIEFKQKEVQAQLEVHRERLVAPLRTKLVEVVDAVDDLRGLAALIQPVGHAIAVGVVRVVVRAGVAAVGRPVTVGIGGIRLPSNLDTQAVIAQAGVEQGIGLGGDPMEFRLFGRGISLRQEQARQFAVAPVAAGGD